MTVTAREIYLTRYPDGLPAPDSFIVKERELPAPQDGEIATRIVWMSVDPYMRGRMNPNVKSYIPPFSLDEPLDGGAVSQVIASRHKDFSVGDYVVGFNGGWRDHWVGKPEMFQKVDPAMAPLSAYLGVLGMPGLTAWAGVSQILKPVEGDTMFVSGAAGAVGSIVCQIAKLKGCKVIASAGSEEKCQWLRDELGVDMALNYRDYKNSTELTKALAEHAPKGINCYFENVGGMHLEATLNVIAFGGRIALCGMISQYNNEKPEPGPSNLINLIGRGGLMQGFIVSNYAHLALEFFSEMAPWVGAGRVKFRETVYNGLEAAPKAFLGLFSGENTGKAVIRVGPDKV